MSRRVTFTYDAPDDETADWFADYLRRLAMRPVNEPVEFADLARLASVLLTDVAWSSERVVPEEGLLEPPPRRPEVRRG